MNQAIYFFVLAIVVCLEVPKTTAVLRPQYQHFEDYLNSLDTSDQSWLANNQNNNKNTNNSLEPDDGTEEDDNDEDATTTTTTTTPVTTTEVPTQLSLQQTREVTCCLLGQLAGDKGYHCYVQYYAARLILRNRNRAHNRKMNFYGRERIPNYGEKVMRTFEQCVNGMGVIFHKCCHLASMEKRPVRYETNRSRGHQTRHQVHRDQHVTNTTAETDLN